VSEFEIIQARRTRHEAVRKLIGILADGVTVEQAGRRLLILDFVLNREEDDQQRDLAARLRISEAGVSSGLKFAREILSEISGD
jgi:hypothetical protein